MSSSAPDPDYFVQLPFTADAQALEDNAIESLRAAWPDWEPNDGDPEVVTIEAIGPMAANAAALAALMPLSALVNYGVNLLGVPFQPGTPASTTVTFVIDDPSGLGGLTIEAGSQLAIDGYAFALLNDVTLVAGSTTMDGEVVAAENSTEYNDLAGAVVMPITMPPFVVAMSVDAPTAGGLDPQDTASYASDLSQELRLTIRTIVTLPDIEEAAMAVQGVVRAHASTDSARNVTVWLLSENPPSGVSFDIKDELAVIYQANRLVNVTFTIADPSFSGINVTWAATFYAGFDPADAVARGNAALTAELSAWGEPSVGDPGNATTQWFNQPTVKAARLATVLSQVQGCYEVDSVAINGHPAGQDFVMPGDVPLPLPGPMTGTVTIQS